ncbi:MAG: hypothetical protein DRG24_08705, partial [Epsilonproteobacteria bacterium]
MPLRSLLTLFILFLLSSGLTAQICDDNSCELDNYHLRSSTSILHDTQTDDNLNISNYSAQGSVEILSKDQTTVLLRIDHARFDLFNHYECSDVNCSDFQPSASELYFVDRNDSDDNNLTLTLSATGHTILVSSLKIDLSSADQIGLGLSGSIGLTSSAERPRFGMDGTLNLLLGGSDNHYDQLSIHTFQINDKSNTSFSATSSACQSSSDYLPITIGNVKLEANTICINDSKEGLSFKNSNGSNTYVNALHSTRENIGIRLPSSFESIEIDLKNIPKAINLNDETVALSDALSLNASGICIKTMLDGENDNSVTSGYADCGTYETLTVGGLKLFDAIATIDLKSTKLTQLEFSTAKKMRTSLPDVASHQTWYGSILNDDFYFASDSLTHFSKEANRTISVAYGYMCDTELSDNAQYYYKSTLGILVDSNLQTTYSEQDGVISVIEPKALLAMQKQYHILHTDLNNSQYAISLKLTDDQLPSLLITDHGSDFLTNYHAALQEMGTIFFDLSSSETLMLEADFSREIDTQSGGEYLYAQLPILDILTLEIQEAEGKLLGSVDHFSTQGYTFFAENAMAYASNGLPTLPENFTLQYESGVKVNVSLESRYASIQVNKDHALQAARISLHKDGTATIEPEANATIIFGDGSRVQLRNFVTLDLLKNTLEIDADTDSTISLGDRKFYIENGLSFSMDDLENGTFEGAIATTAQQSEGFHFSGKGDFNIKSRLFSAITQVYTEKLDDPRYQLNVYYPVVYMGRLGIWTDGLNTLDFTEGNISSTISSLHFASHSDGGQLIDFILHNTKVSADPDSGEIIGVYPSIECDYFDDPPTCNVDPTPSVDYVSPTGTSYFISGADLDFIQKEGSPQLIRLKSPVQIQEGSGTAYNIDGDVDIDYINRKIVRIQPKPGTGLVLNEHIAIYSDEAMSMDGDVLVVTGNINVGPASIANECSTVHNCINFNGTLRFNTATVSFVDIVTNGTLDVPNPQKTTVSVTNLTSINGSAYFKSEESGLHIESGTESANTIGLVIDFNDKKVSAVKTDNSYIWAKSDTFFLPQSGAMVADGGIVLSSADNVPPMLGGTAPLQSHGVLANALSLEEIITKAKVNISADETNIIVTDMKVTYGNYIVGIKDNGSF